MTKFLQIIIASAMVLGGVAEAHAKDKEVVADQLEQCGAFVRTAPFCNESLEADTRQLQAIQIIPVTLSSETAMEWAKLHREKKRGVSLVETNEKGEKVQTGRPALNAVARVIALPPSGLLDEAMLFQALVSPDMKSVMVFLPAEGDFRGWSIYILSSEGKHALALSGELIKLDGRHRTDGNLEPDVARLPVSQVAGTTLVTRGDGSNVIEDLEATFLDHVLVHDRDGTTRVYSGLRGTFTPSHENGLSVAMAYTNCRTAGQRLVERGNLRADTSVLIAGPIVLAPQLVQNMLAVFRASCR